MQRDLKFLNALNTIPGLGAGALRTLKNRFETYEAAWAASETDLLQAGLSARTMQSVLWKRPSIHPDKEMEKLVKEHIWCVSFEDKEFPEYLREISYPPAILYGRGDIQALDQKKLFIGIVGTRRPTNYGSEAAQIITHELARAGCIIVSGLALGIDGRAHEAALDEKGATVAVIGSGVDHGTVFPSEHRGLARRISESGGAVISEYAPGVPPLKEHFPQRNRIISGLSKGLLVIEARERSGALITARFALEQNREVFALPGSIFSHTSRGPNKLIQEGAKLIQSARDVLEEFGIEYTKERGEALDLTESEKNILDLLGEPIDVDTIKEKTGLAASVILTSLSMLELKGIIKNLGQDTYQKTYLEN